MRSGNPALSESTFLDLASGSVVARPHHAVRPPSPSPPPPPGPGARRGPAPTRR